MLMLLFYVVFLISTVVCRYSGDSCVADNKNGICSPLSRCQSLLDEIRAAGSPMPMHMRNKLQKITCGYESRDPLVCCSDDNDNWGLATTHGIDVPNRRKPTPVDDGSITFWGTEDKKGSQFNNIVDPDDKDNKVVTELNDRPPNVENHPNLSILTSSCGSIESDKISGGNRTRLYEMPWMVLLSYDTGRETRLSCGGTLINEWYVLTAAHCVEFLGERLKLQSVILGEYDIRTDPDCETLDNTESCAPNIRTVSVDSVIAHPGYKPQTLFDDIALIRLSEPADFSIPTMGAICLPTTPELQREELVGQRAVVAGWGVTEIGLQSPVLLSVSLPIMTNKDCETAYRGSPRIREKQVCAGGEQVKDSCGGDSGGPLIYPGITRTGGVRYVQRGIVSFGSKRCGVGGYPGVYTRVSYYMDWILDNINS